MILYAFEALQISISCLCLAPVRGYDLMEPYDSISLPVIFSKVDSFPPEHIIFNILDFDLT
jgi:hypothetical protein